MFFIFFNLYLLVVIFFLIIFISWFWPPDSPWAPWWKTNKKTAERMCVLGKVSEKTLIYDLGCGTGTAICVASKKFGSPCVGIEIDPLRFIIAWIKVNIFYKLNNRVTIVRDNFFNINLSSADVFFIYLIPNALKRLTPKFIKEVKSGAIFVSLIYQMPIELFNNKLKLIEHDTKNKIFVYKFIK